MVYFLHIGGLNPEYSFSLRGHHQVLAIISKSKQIDGSFQLLSTPSDDSFGQTAGKHFSFNATSIDHVVSYSHGRYFLFMELSTSFDDLSTLGCDNP